MMIMSYRLNGLCCLLTAYVKRVWGGIILTGATRPMGAFLVSWFLDLEWMVIFLGGGGGRVGLYGF